LISLEKGKPKIIPENMKEKFGQYLKIMKSNAEVAMILVPEKSDR